MILPLFRSLTLGALVGIAPVAGAGPGVPRAANADGRLSVNAAGAHVARSDLALAYLRFDRAFAEAGCRDTELARINRRFDAVTRLFFFRRFAEAVVALNDLTESLSAPDAGETAPPIASCSVRVEPSPWSLGSAAPPLLRIATIGGPIRDAVAGLELLVRDSDGVVVWRRPISAEDVGAAGREGLALDDLAGKLVPGRFRCELQDAHRPASLGALARPFDVVARPPEELQRTNAELLDSITPAGPEMSRAIFIARARNSLLHAPAGSESSVQIVSGVTALAFDVSQEVEAILSGRNPYRRLKGDHWRAVEVGGQAIPVRVFAPIGDDTERPRPLFIALHGAGGDENLFMNGYGAGMIKDLAARDGFIVAAPLTYGFIGSAAALDRLIFDLADDYAIDARRVYVLGHSLGAIAAVGLASGRPDTIAGTCCIAGFRPIPTGSRCAPLRVFLAELDPIFPPERVETFVERARAAGIGVDVSVLKDQGHTLVVNEALPAAVEWLLARRLAEPPAR